MDDIRKMLFDMADDKYKAFSEKLVRSQKELIGVRLPDIRKAAKKLIKSKCDAYDNTGSVFFEEIMLRGFLIAFSKKDIKRRLIMAEEHLSLIDNWSCCDSFCAAFKPAESEKEQVFDFIKNFMYSKEEFCVRFFVVMLLDHFIDDGHIDYVIKILPLIKHGGYYVQMAVSWAVCECFIKYREKTLELIKSGKLCSFVQNKAISKIRDSYRVSPCDKKMLLAYRK